MCCSIGPSAAGSLKRKLAGKVALVTGGNSGIGLATAQRFVAEDATQVYSTGRRQPALETAVKTIGQRVTAVRSDMSNLADLDALYAMITQQLTYDAACRIRGGDSYVSKRVPGRFRQRCVCSQSAR